MKPIYVTEIVHEGYDAQVVDPTVNCWEPATWHRRVKNPYAVRELVHKNQHSKGMIDALTSLEARAFELGVWLAYWKYARPNAVYQEGRKFFVSVRVADRLAFLTVTVPRDPKDRPALEG